MNPLLHSRVFAAGRATRKQRYGFVTQPRIYFQRFDSSWGCRSSRAPVSLQFEDAPDRAFCFSEICKEHHKNVISFQYWSILFEKREGYPKNVNHATKTIGSLQLSA
jgi:hypothetical protein